MKRKYGAINTYVLKAVRPNSRILDIGCAMGILGKYIRASKNPQRLVGVDINYKYLMKARECYDFVIAVDVEKSESLPLKYKFDCIVCADVLEHLRNPEMLLLLLKKYLAEDGEIIISVPNAVFVLERFLFLLGKYEYRSTGLRDKSHLRLFTFKSIQRLVENAGYSVEMITGYLNTETLLRYLNFLARFYPPLFGRQLLIICKSKKS